MFNPFTLKNKTILVTGASSGIGRQCAIDCSKMGAKVVLVARNQERLDETRSLMDGEGHLVVCQDLTCFDAIPDTVKNIIDQYNKED